MTIYLIILFITTTLLIWLGARTSILKDFSIQDKTAPYSWSRTQLAFWTGIIFSSFLFLFFKYKEVPGLSDVNLILLGIAATTTASAKLVDDSQKNNPDRAQDKPSEGFLRDILSDKNGISIHRLQNVLWTLAVGIIYINFVAASKELPDETVLTNNLLILMGISTGAYLGLKITENAK